MSDSNSVNPETTYTDSFIATLRLAMISGVGPRIRKSLLTRFGCAEAVFDAAPSELRLVEGVGPKLSSKIVLAKDEIDVEAEIDLCRENNISIVTEDCPEYPRMLKEIHDPPGIFFMQGKILPQDALSVAIVGSRHASHYGLRQAERFAAGLSRAGMTVISGMARGVDGAAHRGVLAAAGRTIAVLGGGLLNIYPPEHKELACDIADNGAVISETPPLGAPVSGAFPQRNRLITGMSLGVVVIEASQRSGALISARHAMEQGREVFALPGRVDSRTSQGCHQLIRDGAKLVENVDDVLEEFGPLVDSAPDEQGRSMRHPAELQLNDQEKKVLDAILSEPTSIDQAVVTSGLPVHRVLSTISVLEMRRLIRRVSGNLVARL